MQKLKRCCGGKKKEDDEFQRNSGEKREIQEQLKKESIARNTKILREDLYQNYMKPYFKLG